MIDFGNGYSCSFRMMKVDPKTWAASEEVKGFLSASYERDSDSDLLESGSARFDFMVSEDEFYGRIEMLARQDGEVERHPIVTLLFSPGPTTDTVGSKTVEYSGRSVLAPAIDQDMLVGSYAPAGSDAAAYAASLISKCTPAPVVVEGGFTITQHYVFAQGTDHLEAARTLLDGAGWRMRVGDDGTIVIGPKPESPSLVLDAAHASLLAPEITGDGSLEEKHNRYIAVDGERQAVVVNDDRDDPASFSRRNRYVDIYDDSPQLCNGESLEAYAARKLAEDNESLGTRSYRREWCPDVTTSDLVVGSISSVGLDANMRVKTQSAEIGRGIVVNETSEVLR